MSSVCANFVYLLYIPLKLVYIQYTPLSCVHFPTQIPHSPHSRCDPVVISTLECGLQHGLCYMSHGGGCKLSANLGLEVGFVHVVMEE